MLLVEKDCLLRNYVLTHRSPSKLTVLPVNHDALSFLRYCTHLQKTSCSRGTLASSFTYITALTVVHGFACPTSAPLCDGVGVALSVKVIVPGRFTPVAEPTFVNLTLIVQLAPGAKVIPVQASAFTLKNQVNAPEPGE